MSLLIKGMEMPPNCFECPCCDTHYGTCKATKNQPRAGVYGIPKWCPLVEVPTPHGRLIDADALETTAIDAIEEGIHAADILLDIRFAPTIVEAEGGGEDG